jgi:hypothetical protein
MQPQPEWADAPSLNKKQLAEHLSVGCYKTVDEILAQTGLRPAFGSYPWRRILRAVHGTEGALLPGHLASLKARHGTSPFDHIADAAEREVERAKATGSPLIDEIEDLEAALKEPLWSFAEMARELGEKPDTLSKALRQKRRSLPFPTLQLGTRLRLYRPLEVRLWRDEEILLELPAALRIVAASPPAEAPVVAWEQTAESDAPTGDADAPTPAEEVKKAIFGGFAGNSRKKSA